MSTGQTRTYPFGKGKDRLMSACTFLYGSATLCFPLYYHFPTTQPLFPLENAIHFTAAYAYGGLLLSSNLSSCISQMTVFNAI